MLKVPPITSSLIIHTELNQEVDMQRYIFLITYDVLGIRKDGGILHDVYDGYLYNLF